MKISIVTCTYDRHYLLKKNINSVLKQKFKNYEHFVIDDGSVDNTEKLIKNFPHIKYIKLKKNYGQPGAMYYSKVLKKISGDYVILLDSDDYFLKDAKKIILKFINDKRNKDVWSFSFNTKNNTNNNISFKSHKINSKSIYHDKHIRFNEGKGFRDFCDVRKKIYYKKFNKYFISPKYWYSSFVEVNLKNNFKEFYINKKIISMNFGIDNVTKGQNLKKYAPITLHTRQYLFRKFRNKMEKKYYNYSLKSLFFNQIIFPNYKLKNLKLLIKEKNKFTRKTDFFLLLLLLLLPYRLLFFLKKILKSTRKFR